jgi:lipoate-protein ligase A
LVLDYERAPELRQVNASYGWILGRIRDSLRDLAAVQLSGISDLAIGERKFSGNAQQRKAKSVLHHGTLLFDLDLPMVGRYLNSPEREPAYREGRGHDSFVANFPAGAEMLKRRIAAAFDAEPGPIDEAVVARIPALIAERYSRTEWNERR